MSDPFARYDISLANPPSGGAYPLRCSNCGEQFFDTEDHAQDEPHCRDEDEPHVVVGTLQWDWNYDWRDDDPRIP